MKKRIRRNYMFLILIVLYPVLIKVLSLSPLDAILVISALAFMREIYRHFRDGMALLVKPGIVV